MKFGSVSSLLNRTNSVDVSLVKAHPIFNDNTSFVCLEITAPLATFLKVFATLDTDTSKQEENWKI